MNYSSSGAITHTGGAQRRTGGAADAKYSDDKEAKEFYFLGEVFAQGEPNSIKMDKTGDDAFEINYKLDVPVRDDIYEYIVSEA